MRRTLVLGLALALALPFAACEQQKRGAPAAQGENVQLVSIDDLAARLDHATAQPVDANGPQLRQDVGIIPGAVLLSDYEAYSLKELPADKATPLVFYCANEDCDASHVAAKRALSAGYQHVQVLAAGILGWRKAGRAMAKPPVAAPPA
ncbi:MAG TPA: rhodanese-like domain-containing protein [Kofleriaceae bacterium]|nr:rhodanese-like domain-containing protein [Kofleriaceae bacterium]